MLITPGLKINTMEKSLSNISFFCANAALYVMGHSYFRFEAMSNRLSGRITGNLTANTLKLSHNQLSDTIPASVGDGSSTVELSYNKLTGRTPAVLGHVY